MEAYPSSANAPEHPTEPLKLIIKLVWTLIKSSDIIVKKEIGDIMDHNIKFISAPYAVDRKLYKYYSNVGHAIDCIKKGRIHLDDPQGFNDPFEAKWQFSNYTWLNMEMVGKLIFDKIIDYVATLPREKHGLHHSKILHAIVSSHFPYTYGTKILPINEAITQIYTSFQPVEFTFEEFCDEINSGFSYSDGFMRLACKMSCFTEVCDSILMWSYYANSHRGVCLEFDLSKLDPSVSLNRDILAHLTKVHYSPIRSDLQHAVSNIEDYNFLVSKADVWAHEQEWRLICETDEDYLPFDCVSKVILGVNFNKDAANYKELHKLCKSIDIEQCKLSKEKFRIEFQTIYDSIYMRYVETAAEDAPAP